jgi:hypothetical protein
VLRARAARLGDAAKRRKAYRFIRQLVGLLALKGEVG